MRIATVLLPLLALLLAACGERPEPLARELSPYPLTVRGAGEQPTTVAERPERIVAVDPGSAELLARLGAADRLVGVPAGVVPGAARVVTPGGQIEVDRVVRLDPDLIVATPAIDPVDLSLAERRSRAALYVQPDRSVDDVVRGALELGFLIGEPVRARRLAAALRRGIAAVESRVARREPVRVFVDEGFLIPPPDRSLLADLVRRAGGESVIRGGSGGEPVKPCRVARRRPEVLVHVYETGTIRTPPPPRFTGCRVPRRKLPRVVRLPAELVTRPGPRVARAVAAIARALHPDAFR